MLLAQVFLTPTHLAMAMEYAPAGDLYHHLLFQHSPTHCMSEEKARWMFQQLIIGLDYCHRKARTLPLCLCSVCPIPSAATLDLYSPTMHRCLASLPGMQASLPDPAMHTHTMWRQACSGLLLSQRPLSLKHQQANACLLLRRVGEHSQTWQYQPSSCHSAAVTLMAQHLA